MLPLGPTWSLQLTPRVAPPQPPLPPSGIWGKLTKTAGPNHNNEVPPEEPALEPTSYWAHFQHLLAKFPSAGGAALEEPPEEPSPLMDPLNGWRSLGQWVWGAKSKQTNTSGDSESTTTSSQAQSLWQRLSAAFTTTPINCDESAPPTRNPTPNNRPLNRSAGQTGPQTAGPPLAAQISNADPGTFRGWLDWILSPSTNRILAAVSDQGALHRFACSVFRHFNGMAGKTWAAPGWKWVANLSDSCNQKPPAEAPNKPTAADSDKLSMNTSVGEQPARQPEQENAFDPLAQLGAGHSSLNSRQWAPLLHQTGFLSARADSSAATKGR